MAKHDLSQTGWIDFTGLRFAKKFATREEIVQAIRGFFSRRGLNFGELKVEFRQTRNPASVDVNSLPLIGNMSSFPLSVRVFVKVVGGCHWLDPRWQFFETLFHELDHVAWFQEGKPFNHALPYWDRPHEIRAREIAGEEASLFLHSLVGS